MLSAIFIALINYAVITSSEDVLELAKDFTALIIIAEIDNQFAGLSREETVKDALENPDYATLFKIETTSSLDARKHANECLSKDPAHELINKRIKYRNEQIRAKNEDFEGMKIQEEVQRPRGISIKMSKRPCCNMIQASFYKLLRFLFVSIWFYYIPLVVVLLTNVLPIVDHWKLKQEC